MREPDAGGPGPSFREDADLNEMMGLYDVPAFARRGRDVEYALGALHARCGKKRAELLDMVHVRLRQWAAAAVGPDDWADALGAPIQALWPLSDADPPRWAAAGASTRRRRAIVRDLIASVGRFNARWSEFVAKLNLQVINAEIADYNNYYLLEKECALGSTRLALLGYRPIEPVSTETILADHPVLPVPEPR